VLSSTLLTSGRALAVLALVLRRTFVRLNSRAQNALTDTLAELPAAPGHEPGTSPPPAP